MKKFFALLLLLVSFFLLSGCDFIQTTSTIEPTTIDPTTIATTSEELTGEQKVQRNKEILNTALTDATKSAIFSTSKAISLSDSMDFDYIINLKSYNDEVVNKSLVLKLEASFILDLDLDKGTVALNLNIKLVDLEVPELTETELNEKELSIYNKTIEIINAIFDTDKEKDGFEGTLSLDIYYEDYKFYIAPSEYLNTYIRPILVSLGVEIDEENVSPIYLLDVTPMADTKMNDDPLTIFASLIEGSKGKSFLEIATSFLPTLVKTGAISLTGEVSFDGIVDASLSYYFSKNVDTDEESKQSLSDRVHAVVDSILEKISLAKEESNNIVTYSIKAINLNPFNLVIISKDGLDITLGDVVLSDEAVINSFNVSFTCEASFDKTGLVPVLLGSKASFSLSGNIELNKDEDEDADDIPFALNFDLTNHNELLVSSKLTLSLKDEDKKNAVPLTLDELLNTLKTIISIKVDK